MGDPKHPGPVWVRRRIGLLLALAPVLVLAAAYGWLCVAHGTVWPWLRIVHENGRLSLLQTVFYAGHFVRELPPSFLMALSAALALAPRGVSRRAGLGGLLVFAGVTGVAAAVAVAREGGAVVLGGLLQQTMRDGEQVRGIHWQGHVLPVLWFQMACVALGRWLGLAGGGRRWWMLLFVAACAGFGVGGGVLSDPRLLGHQAREILTHGLVTLPLTAAVVIRFSAPAEARGRAAGCRWWWLALSVALVPAVLLVAMAGRPVAAAAQTDALDALVAAHFFEHSLDYVAVPALALALGMGKRGK